MAAEEEEARGKKRRQGGGRRRRRQGERGAGGEGSWDEGRETDEGPD
jgi:hypothetical protein